MTGRGIELEELYGAEIVAAMGHRAEVAAPRAGASASVALTAALLTGLAAALEDVVPEAAIAEFEPERRSGRLEPVTVTLVPGAPAASVALVRPWLL